MSERLLVKGPGGGLQPERTWLAWSRTSFGAFGNGALLLVHDLHGLSGSWRYLPASLAAAVAVLIYLTGRRRQRLLRRRPLTGHIAPRSAVRLVGASIQLLIVVTTAMLVTA
jgi:uncharacterized membrane protein YidH (DUF202 family)